jgi:glycosyltransferase involved in cell wall biosynthesis
LSSEPIRIAQIIGKMMAGGVESVVFNYYRNIDKSKFQFDFYYDADSIIEPPQDLIEMGARFIKIPPYQKLPSYIKALRRHFKENKYEIVHSNMNTLSVFPLYAAWKSKIPTRIAHSHSTASKGETKRNILKYILRPFSKLFATDYCACSKYAGEWLFGKRAVKKGKVTVFNNAIELSKFRFNQQVRDDIRKELDIENKFVVGHVGRFCYQKNHEFLIDIFEEIHKKREDAVLVLVGIGELTDDIKQKVHDKGLDDVVLFLGKRTDVNQLYQAMDVFIFPSRYEGLGLVAIEAQASGLYAVCSDVLPIEANASHNARFISLNKSAATWADEVLALCENKQDRLTAVTEVAEAGYDITKEAKKLETFYDNRLK